MQAHFAIELDNDNRPRQDLQNPQSSCCAKLITFAGIADGSRKIRSSHFLKDRLSRQPGAALPYFTRAASDFLWQIRCTDSLKDRAVFCCQERESAVTHRLIFLSCSESFLTIDMGMPLGGREASGAGLWGRAAGCVVGAEYRLGQAVAKSNGLTSRRYGAAPCEAVPAGHGRVHRQGVGISQRVPFLGGQKWA